MKLIIKQYLASLRERGELDAILPDLLSQMGLNVISRPGRGTRQSGVDVAAVGNIGDGKEKIYLFSIKPGDLTRNSWRDGSVQSLRPSLDEIIDTYIPNRIPLEHKDKDVVICICLGGDIQEQVREDVVGYVNRNTREHLTFEEWNGDKLASLILEFFLREDLLPQNARSKLRKSLALLDEPESSYHHFAKLIKSLSKAENLKADREMIVLRQINICLWILFSWARDTDVDNLEAAYLASEISVLHAWEITKPYANQDTKNATTIQMAFISILSLYQEICLKYVYQKILPGVYKKHALSFAVRASHNLDVNLKLFDVLGRLALSGIWAYFGIKSDDEQTSINNEQLLQNFQVASAAVKQIISNNPILLLPVKDDQAIDISLAVLLLMFDKNNHKSIADWLSELTTRTAFALKIRDQYPCTLRSYGELLELSETHDSERFKEVTQGSILLPMIALWAALLDDNETYHQVQNIKRELLSHCNFQIWYPDEESEALVYINSDSHGATLSHVCVDRPMDEFLKQVFGECEHSSQFDKLSAVKSGLWPLLLVACRHYRLPLPPHLWNFFKVSPEKSID